MQLEPVALSLDTLDTVSEEITQENPFGALGLDAELSAGLAALGFLEPTAIQREAIPALIEGRDVLGQAATGTGKTAAFALPLLHRLKSQPSKGGVRALILVPTRELAMQVSQAVASYGRKLALRVLAVYGGQAMHLQLRALERGVDVVVATPGRAMDHLRRGSLKLEHVEMVVLDEADEMLDMGFAEDIDTVLRTVPAERQTALFSATLPRRIVNIANSHLREPVRVRVEPQSVTEGVAPLVKEHVYIVGRRFKGAALARILDMDADYKSVIVFCRTRTDVDDLTATLNSRGKSAEAIHGGLSQEQRDRVLRRFRDGSLRMLIATDVAARGLDIDHVSHVVNYDLPTSPEVYVHRIGRTGRAGREGTAITMIDARDQRLIRNLEAHTKRKLTVMTVPSVTELRAQRLTMLQATLEAANTEEGLEQYYQVIDAMTEAQSPRTIAAIALKLLDAARPGSSDLDVEIPVERVAMPVEFKKDGGRQIGAPRREAAPRNREPHAQIPNPVKLYVTVGRRDGIRPGDLVGAIANLANIEGRSIGSISLSDRFTLVEVPEQKAQGIIDALRGATIRGKKVSARFDRDASGAAAPSLPHATPRRAPAHVAKRKREAVPA